MSDAVFEIFMDEEEDDALDKGKSVGRLTDMETREVSVVDRAANKRRFLMIKRNEEGNMADNAATIETEDTDKAATKTEGGEQFPAGAYAYVPDATKPSTWKLRLYDTPADVSAGKPSIRYTAAAAQALSPAGFRGNPVQIPAADRAAVKNKVRAAWLKARRNDGQEVSEADLPQALKKNEESDMATATTETETTKPEVSKSVVSAVLEQAGERVSKLIEAIEGAEVVKAEASDASDILREARAIQFMLKSLAGVAKSALVIPLVNADVTLESVTKSFKTKTLKVLKEVARRIDTDKADLVDVDVLDPQQGQRINGTADLLGKVPQSFAKGALIVASSVDVETRKVLLEKIESSMDGLMEVYVALQTDSVAKGATSVADEIMVCSTIDENLASLEKAIAEVLLSKTEGPSITAMIQGLRDVKKNLGETPEVIDALSVANRDIGLVSKASGFYCAEYSNGGGKVVLEYPEEVVAEFGSYDEAKAHAFRLNVQAILGMGMMKAATTKGEFTVQRKDGKFCVMDPTGKMVSEHDNPVDANKACASHNAKKAGAAKQDTTGEEANVEANDEGSQTETNKVGRPMNGDRLNRLKGAVGLLKQALGDLRAGSVSMEKFKKVGDVLAALINELQVAKRDSESKQGGAQERNASTQAPNVGAGYSPDTETYGGDASNVMGDGTQQTAQLLKRMEEKLDAKLEQALSEKDDEIASLKGQLTSLRKARSAPSTPPEDEEIVSTGTKTQKNDDKVAWPSDMASWDGDEDNIN